MHTRENVNRAAATKVGDDTTDIVSEPSRRAKRHSEEDTKTTKRAALVDMTNKPQASSRQTRAAKKKDTSESIKIVPHTSNASESITRMAPVSIEYATKTSLPIDVADIDCGDEKDPQLCSIYVQDIYTYLREIQMTYRPQNYMDVQKDISIPMRAILVDWLVEVAEEYRLSSETLYLAVSYVDRYLSKRLVNRGKLQLVGVASILVAAKFEEIYAPSVEDMVFIADNTYSKEEVFAMESSVLDVLEFRLSGATIRSFLKRFLKAACVGTDPVVCMFASYLCELSLQHYDCLKFLPSVVAASATILALITLKRPYYWNSTLEYHTNHHITDPEIICCIRELYNLHKLAPEANLQAVREKYDGFYKVSDPAVIPPIASLPLFDM